MRLPFRIISAKRLDQVEAVEKLHDLRFIRGAVEDVVQHFDGVLEHLRCTASHSDGLRRELTLSAIDKLRSLRINLVAVLFRVGR